MTNRPEKTVRTSIRVPVEIHEFIRESCTRVITVKGKQIKICKSINDAYLEVIKRGVMSYEETPEE